MLDLEVGGNSCLTWRWGVGVTKEVGDLLDLEVGEVTLA